MIPFFRIRSYFCKLSIEIETVHMVKPCKAPPILYMTYPKKSSCKKVTKLQPYNFTETIYQYKTVEYESAAIMIT